MAIGVIGTNSVATTNASATSITVSHTVPSTDANRMLIVVYTSESAEATSATFGAANMTEGSTHLGSDHLAWNVHFFWLANPATGLDTVTVNFASNATRRYVGAITLKDAAQSLPINGQGISSGYPTNETARQTTITPTAVASLFFTLTALGTAASAVVQDTGQTEQINNDAGTSHEINVGTESANVTSYVGGISWTGAVLAEQHVFGISEFGVGGNNLVSLMGVG